MGLPIERTDFAPDDYARFRERLAADLRALSSLLSRPDFGVGPLSLGAELELHLIDARARPTPCNQAVLDELHNPLVTLEINRFNLEFNAPPLALAGAPFEAMRAQLAAAQRMLAEAAAHQHARTAAVGILPTLRLSDLGPESLSPRPRFQALSEALRRQRGEPFRVHIEGLDTLRARGDDVTLEGANASFQVHLRVPPRNFVRHYNAAQLTAAPALACAGNSPFFAGCRLWEETRVALFKQAVDTRAPRTDVRAARPPARVSFGQRWVESPLEPFQRSVALHDPLLPVVQGPEPEGVLAQGATPELSALRLHHSTVWTWNRAIFDPIDGGHLRIEHRALPAGPSTLDMVANAAFTLGLTLGFADRADELTRRLPFEMASRNFHAAAKHGLTAELTWPERGGALRRYHARDLVLALLPDAELGLSRAGVAADDYQPLLALLRARTESGRTGAQVQRALLDHYARFMPLYEALGATLEHYLDQASRDLPVHTWKLPQARVMYLPAKAGS